MIKEIYLAGGCFWGMQKYLKLIRGIISTEVGFANGHTETPSYKEVYTDTTGHAETVKVIYDSDILQLENLVRFFFKAIDPLSMNRQGKDEGSRYRTGVYYTDEAEKTAIISVFDEEYHQDYLDKNPNGYCHLTPELFEVAKSING